jgi:hypothetical protein
MQMGISLLEAVKATLPILHETGHHLPYECDAIDAEIVTYTELYNSPMSKALL